MKQIKILGTGCPNCRQLERVTEQALQELGLEFEMEKVTDLEGILSYDVMMTPALVVDGKVKLAGKVPSAEQIKELLR